MKIPVAVLSLIVAGELTVVLPAGAAAEQVQHHDMTAESEGRSADCLYCHDGLSARAVSYCTVKCDFRSSAHVIEKKYPPARKRESYAPIETVTAKGVRFVNGKVTCISCHNLKNPAKYHLIVNSKRELCLICHYRIGHF